MATKTKTIELHATFDGAGVDGLLLDAILQGEEVVATPAPGKFGGLPYVKRAGVKYTMGDVIEGFGELPGDDSLARGGKVQTKRLYEAQRLEGERRKYRRDILGPLEARHSRAASAHNAATAAVTRLEAELKAARQAVKDAAATLEDVAGELQTARKASP